MTTEINIYGKGGEEISAFRERTEHWLAKGGRKMGKFEQIACHTMV